MAVKELPVKARALAKNVKTYWHVPPKGRYMTFKEIGAYAFGGIGSYILMMLGSNLLVGTTNMIVGGAIGVGAMDMYVLYLISTLAGIPLTGLRANMIDNSRARGGKYRPYLITMGLPTAIIAILYVWFPYEWLYTVMHGQMFGRDSAYVVKCAMVLLFNFGLQFFYWFFCDAYTNLIHVLSPDTQERTDVLAVKSIVYSMGPSIMNVVMPLAAQFIADNNMYDIRVYRYTYPVLAVIGFALTAVVYANTTEKIVQARTHTIQIRFFDALREVAKNKYFWIIALAGWLGFLESSYGNIIQWSYSYGHTCTGAQLALIQTLTGNASLWGMLLAPICIRKWGKKKVLIGVNFLNVVFILAMRANIESIVWISVCVYFNWMVGAFEQITTPAIQADIRDYQQYKTGERIDGMFAAVGTIGNIVTMITSGVLPAVQTHYGIYDGNGYASPFDILDVDTGEPGLLWKLMGALVLMAALGAFLNMVPYFLYDFTERRQKAVITVLKLRAMFEDYANDALPDDRLKEGIEIIRSAEKTLENPPEIDPAAKGKAKKAQRAAQDDYFIAEFVMKELNKFSDPVCIEEAEIYSDIYGQGLEGIAASDYDELKAGLKAANALPKGTESERELRKFKIELARDRLSAQRNYQKHFAAAAAKLNGADSSAAETSGDGEHFAAGTVFAEPDMTELTELFEKEDALNEKIAAQVKADSETRKKGGKPDKSVVKGMAEEMKRIRQAEKDFSDNYARFNRAAKPWRDARRFLKMKENYAGRDALAAKYDELMDEV